MPRPTDIRALAAGRVGIALLLAAALVAACGGGPAVPGPSAGGRLQVVTTTTVFADLAAQVGGDRVDAQSLVPKGGDVHTFDPRPSDIRRIASAAVVIRNGLGLDDWLAKLVADASSSASEVVLGEHLAGVTYVTSASGQVNPHVWMNVAYAALYVDRIEAALAAADPADASAFAANAAAYKASLARLDSDTRARLGAIPAANRVVISFHDAFPYFAAAYGLTVVGTIVDAPGQDPSAGQIADLVARVKTSGARAIFAEAQFNTDLAAAIASETGVTVVRGLYDDTLGDAPEDTYLGAMTWNANEVAAALGG